MTIAAYLGIAGLTDVGYQFYNADETAIGSRVDTGIIDAADGWYSATADPAGAGSVRWDSAGDAAITAREYFASSAAAVDTVAIADEILKRDWAEVSGEADASLLQALRSLRNKWEIDTNGILRVFREDGVTLAWSRTVQSTVNAVPVVGME